MPQFFKAVQCWRNVRIIIEKAPVSIQKKKLFMGAISCGRPVVCSTSLVVGRFPIILAEEGGKCMVENADWRPLIGRPSFDSTPLLIENRRSRRSSSRFTQFDFTAI